MTFSHSHKGPSISDTSSRTNSRADSKRSSSDDGVGDVRMSAPNSDRDGDLGRQHEDEEALLEKDMIEHHVPEPDSQTSLVRVSLWIVVNTLATIGIVGPILLPR